MDYLQIALILLIVLLGIFLSITGAQVFFILRDLKKALDNMNKFLQTDEVKTKLEEKRISKNSLPARRLFKNVR